MYAGDSVYGEKRISVEGEKEGEKVEYRVWNPFRYVKLTQDMGAVCSYPPYLLPLSWRMPHRLTMGMLGAGRSWQHQCWLVWTTSTSSLDARCSTWEQRLGPQSAMCQTSWAPLALSMLWSSLTAAVSHVPA